MTSPVRRDMRDTRAAGESERSKSNSMDEFVGGIVREFEIGADNVRSLRHFLNEIAMLCLPTYPPKPTKQLIAFRRTFQQLESALNAFSSALHALNSTERFRLWAFDRAHPMSPELILSMPSNLADAEAPYGHERRFYAMLEELNERIHAQLDTLKLVSDKGGRPKNEALQFCVGRARMFWEDVLDKPFTFSPSKIGLKNGSALSFCWLIFKEFNATLKMRELETAMREVVKRERIPSLRWP